MPLALAMNEPMISSSLCFLDYHDDGEVKKLCDWGSWEFFNCLLAYLDLSPCYHPMPTEAGIGQSSPSAIHELPRLFLRNQTSSKHAN